MSSWQVNEHGLDTRLAREGYLRLHGLHDKVAGTWGGTLPKSVTWSAAFDRLVDRVRALSGR